MPHVLLVEDNEVYARWVQRRLEAEGFEVTRAETGSAAVRRALTLDPDLIVLDIGLPDMHGLQVLETLRSEGDATRVLILSRYRSQADRVSALRAGADDHVPKTHALEELVVRIRALLRRPAAWDAEVEYGRHRLGEFEVGLAQHEVRRFGEIVQLRPMEYRLLSFFLANPEHAFSREELLVAVWRYGKPVRTRTVDDHVARLRTQLGLEPPRPPCITTVRGTGYLLELAPKGGAAPR